MSKPTQRWGAVPIHDAVGMHVDAAEPGRAAARLSGSRTVGDPDGRMTAGALGIVADACCGTVGAVALPLADTVVTVQMRLEYAGLRPLLPGAVTGRAWLEAAAEDSALLRGALVDDESRLVAVCSMRMLGVPRRSAVPPARGPAPGEYVAGVPAPPDPAASSASSAPPVSAPLSSSPHELVGVTDCHVGGGVATFTLCPDSRVANSYQALHGGAVALIAQLTASAVQRDAVGDHGIVEPFDLAVNYLRGVPIDGTPLVSTATITHSGRRFVVAEGELRRADGRPTARFSCGAQIHAAR